MRIRCTNPIHYDPDPAADLDCLECGGTREVEAPEMGLWRSITAGLVLALIVVGVALALFSLALPWVAKGGS